VVGGVVGFGVHPPPNNPPRPAMIQNKGTHMKRKIGGCMPNTITSYTREANMTMLKRTRSLASVESNLKKQNCILPITTRKSNLDQAKRRPASAKSRGTRIHQRDGNASAASEEESAPSTVSPCCARATHVKKKDRETIHAPPITKRCWREKRRNVSKNPVLKEEWKGCMSQIFNDTNTIQLHDEYRMPFCG
jgi:hypothetical protein